MKIILYPPSLSRYGKFRKTAKFESLKLIDCKENNSYVDQDTTGIVIDGATVVQMISPSTAKTFGEYSKN